MEEHASDWSLRDAVDEVLPSAVAVARAEGMDEQIVERIADAACALLAARGVATARGDRAAAHRIAAAYASDLVARRL